MDTVCARCPEEFTALARRSTLLLDRSGIRECAAAAQRQTALAVAGENANRNGGLLADTVLAALHRDFLVGYGANVGRGCGGEAGETDVIASARTLRAGFASAVAVSDLVESVVDGLDFIASSAHGVGSGGDGGLSRCGRLTAIALLTGPGCGRE
jgi:hypothetical protein